MADTNDTSLAQGALTAAQNPDRSALGTQSPTPSPVAGGDSPTNATVDLSGSQADASHDYKGDWTGGGTGIWGKVERGVVNAGGRPASSYTEDSTGNLVAQATQAAPGTLFKNLLVGALTGLSGASRSGAHDLAGGAAAGFGAEENQQVSQDDRARAQAMQQAQQKQQAQKASDEHNTATQEQAVQAANIVHLNAVTAQVSASVAQMGQESRDNFYKSNKDWITDQTTNHGATTLYSGLTMTQALDAQKQNYQLGHTSTFRPVGEQPATDAKGNPILGADGKPQMQELYDVVQMPSATTLDKDTIKDLQKFKIIPQGDITPGQTVTGAQYADLHTKLLLAQGKDLDTQEKQSTIGKNKAETANQYSEANEHNAQAKKINSDLAGSGSGNPNASGSDYLASLPPARAAIVKGVISGGMSLSPRQLQSKDGQAIAADVLRAYPDYDISKQGSYAATRNEFTKGKTSTQINSGGTLLQHLSDLKRLNTLESRIPGTHDYKAFHNLANTAVGELASFYHMPDTDQTINTFNDSLAGVWNRNSAIDEQIDAMTKKFDGYQQQWDNASPSPSLRTAMPGVSEDAKNVLANERPEFVKSHPGFAPKGSNVAPQTSKQPTPPQGATMLVPGSDGKMHWSDGKRDLGVAQ